MITNFCSSCKDDSYNYINGEMYAWVEIPRDVAENDHKSFLIDLAPLLNDFCRENPSVEIIDDAIVNDFVNRIAIKYRSSI